MTIYYVDNAGSNTSPYDTWAKAANLLATAVSAASAGDTIYVAHTHSENTAASMSFNVGTLAAPLRIICANTGAEPPTAVADTAVVATPGAYPITIYAYVYVYGITFKPGGGQFVNAAINIATLGNVIQKYEKCVFDLDSGGASSRLNIGTNSNTQPVDIEFVDCDLKFGGTSQSIYAITSKVRWQGGGIVSGSTTPTTGLLQISSSGEGIDFIMSGFDFSNLASTVSMIATPAYQIGKVVFRNCKLPASWSGSLVLSVIAAGVYVEMINCDGGDFNYRLWCEEVLGTTKDESVRVRSGGANDGTTPLSWKMATNGDVAYPLRVFKSPIIPRWNDVVGSALTVTVDILHDSATNLQNDEVWLELEYLGTNGNPLALFASDAVADILTAPQDQDSSSETWTTTGMTNPNKQKLTANITPYEKGTILGWVCHAKASYTIYADGKLQVATA